MVHTIERDHLFDIREQNDYNIQKKIEGILQKDFVLSTNTTQLGRSLLRITYFDKLMKKDLQKNNRITILHEPNKRIYIQIRGTLTDAQVRQLWNELEKDLKVIKEPDANKEEMSNKDEIINIIINSIKSKGYNIENIDAQDFVDNFQKKYNRLPKNEELESIVLGYIIMKLDESFIKKSEKSNKEAIAEKEELIFKKNRKIINLTPDQNSVLIISSRNGRRKCPSCENEGLIHEVDDKSIIILDYPKIYGKKYRCGVCGQEWREK